MRVGVVTFPGSNCDGDTLEAFEFLDVPTKNLWYTDTDLTDVDAVVLPGGFSYGDYLRSGALAAKAPMMTAIRDAVQARGLPVLGICNGFQILTEAGLLPGALRANRHGQFRSAWQTLRVTNESPLFLGLSQGELLRLPIAHAEGSYYAPAGALADLFMSQEVWLQYVDERGDLNTLTNPNGSLANIAGIFRGNVAALMPHPERALEEPFGSEDGRRLLTAWVKGLQERGAHAS